MGSSDEHYRWQFERLLRLHEEGPREQYEELCHKFLIRGQDITEPLVDFIAGHPPGPSIAVLLELLGKAGDPRSAGVLIHYLESPVRELRVQAAIALGWLRARAALDKLDHLEGNDPDEEVRRESGIALEEILRDYPAFRAHLKNHRPLVFDEDALDIGEDDDPDVLYPVSPETHKQLAALFPRVLALRHRAVPLGFEQAGTVLFAVLAAEAADTVGEDLKRLTGREVRLCAWPEHQLFERLLKFYKWGDDDWVKLGHDLSEPARREIAEVVLAKVDPAAPSAPLAECVDSIEAVQSFLSHCLRESASGARIEHDRSARSLKLNIERRTGAAFELEPPAPRVCDPFHRVLLVLAGCPAAEGAGRSVSAGQIRLEPPKGGSPCLIQVTSENKGALEILVLEFLDPQTN